MSKQIIKLTFFFAILAMPSLHAQQATKFSFSAGVGLVPTFVADGAEVNTPPLTFQAGYQVSPRFKVSAFAGYSNSTSSTPYLVTDGQLAQVNNKQILTGLRAELRKDITDKFDVYGGAMLGLNRTKTREFDSNTKVTIEREVGAPTPFDPNAPKSQLLYSGFVGGTFYAAKNLGLFAEVGYGISLLNAGITVKI